MVYFLEDPRSDTVDKYKMCSFCGGDGMIHDDRDGSKKCTVCKGTGWQKIKIKVN